MSSEPGYQERRPGYDFHSFAKLVNQTRKLFQAFPLLSPSRGFFFAPLAIFSIHLSGDLAQDARAHVLADHSSVYLPTARVIKTAALSLLPGHYPCCVTSFRLPRFCI